MRNWREPLEREDSRGAGRSLRPGDNVHYDRGDYSSRRKRFDRYADDDEEEDGKDTAVDLCEF